MPALRVILLKPSKYDTEAYVERFGWGFMPNASLVHLRSMTPKSLGGHTLEVHSIDEYVQTDLSYLKLLQDVSSPTLLALVGVQSHQFHRSLDLAAFALRNGVRHCVIEGPHPMTTDTSAAQGAGVSFSLSEAEQVWEEILSDAIGGSLKPIYGGQARWQAELLDPVTISPDRTELQKYVLPMLGLYPARGCPFTCNFCSVIKIAGRRIRSSPVETVLESLRVAKAAGVRVVMFTSDNLNKYPDAEALLEAIIDEELDLPFFVQCDTQIVRQDKLLGLLGRAGCFQMFVGVESFSRQTLLGVRKAQNHPSLYGEIVEKCRSNGIISHFSNIIGFPEDTLPSIAEHLETLCQLGPDAASFYILTPLPGTEQYTDFKARGLITEHNLDRFDGTQATWGHPSLGSVELEAALYDSYRRFYSGRTIVRNAWSKGRLRGSLLARFHWAFPAFNRYCAYRRCHPMSGGVFRRRLDRATDYAMIRRETYGFDLAPLPDPLALSETDASLNRQVVPA